MNYHNITTDDMLNGDGLRVVLWVAGCDHHCEGCHNQCTWNPQGGIVFDETAKAELFRKLSQPYISGITFSGGDPLYASNSEEIKSLAKEIKTSMPNKSIWLYTGYDLKDINEEIIQYIDVVVDGKFDKNKTIGINKWVGSSNQNVTYLH